MTNKFKKKVGLVLGSGGARGLAHLGVIAELLDAGVPIDVLTGSSVGAWVAAHYALYGDLEKLTDLTVNNRQEKAVAFLEPSWGGGLVRGEKLEKLLTKWLGDKNFSDTRLPLGVAATDLLSGEPVILNSGKIVPAVRASMAIPTLFKPVYLRNHILVDGGLSLPVPVEAAKQLGAEVIIAVNLDNINKNDGKFHTRSQTLVSVAARSVAVLRHNLAQASLRGADVIIEPITGISGIAGFKEYFLKNIGERLLTSGRVAARAKLPEILALIK